MRNPFRDQSGFTLVELLISLVIASVAAAGMFNLYLTYVTSTVRQDQVLQMQQNARVAMDDLERDLRQAGLDVTQGDPALPDQAVFAFAAPYEIIFNANTDSTVGGIRPAAAPSQVPTNPASGVAFYHPANEYPLAETVRWTLDATGDGVLTAADRMDTANPSLYRLARQVFGYSALSGANGPQTSTSAEALRGPDAYPDGTRPPVLFQYWINEIDLNDDNLVDAGEDINGNGIIDRFLWGDDGGTAGLASPLASNGVLDGPEIEALMTGNGGGPKVMDSFDAPITAATGDARATTLTRAEALSNIARVAVNVVTETQVADPAYTNSPHGSTYPYREQSVISSVTPRNVLTDVASEMQLTVTASPAAIQCPNNSTTLQVRLVDAAGTLVTDPVDVTMTTSVGMFSPSNTQSATVATMGGVATFSLVGDLNSNATKAVVNATTSYLNKPYSAATTVDFVAAAPSSIVLAPDASSLPADGLSSTTIHATLIDACGKPAGDGSNLSWSVTTNPLGIGGSMTPPVSPISGGTGSALLTSGTSSGMAIVSATETATGVTGVTTVSYTDCVLAMTSGLPAIPADGTSTTTVTLLLTDNSGTPQPGVTVNLSTDAGGVSPAQVVTDASGNATATLTSDVIPHTAQVTGSVPATGGACDLTLGRAQVDFSDCGVRLVSDVTEVTPGNPGTQAVLTATVLDSTSGAPLASQPLTFSHSGTDGSISVTSTTTNGSGQGQTVYTAGPTFGVANIGVASGCGVASVDIYVRDCVVSVQAQPASMPPTWGNTSVITATITDSISGVPLAGREVTFSVNNPALAEFTTPATVTTSMSGTASVTLRALGTAGVVTVTAASACGQSTAQVVLNNWSIALASSSASVTQGGGATLTATITNGGTPTSPAGADNNVTLTFDAPGGLGSTITPASGPTVGGVSGHTFTAGSTSGSVTARASATIGGVLISGSVTLAITDPVASDPIVLDPLSPNACPGDPERAAFTVENVGANDLRVTSIHFTWTGGDKLKRVITEGSVPACNGGSNLWRSDGCGKPDGIKSSPVTLTEFCKDVVIPAGGTYGFNQFRLDNGDLRGETITAIFTHEPVGGGTPSTSSITVVVPF
ncbi:MAG: Ig-like domain-containing protein [Nitrospirae bacterium]|nr:Ig-like domain-containing protein [Nitrospirota bacterium]